MSYESSVTKTYKHGSLLDAIEASFSKLGKTAETITIEDLAPVDEFHIGGRIATDNLLDQLDFSEQDHILDVGCGIGGASRLIATRFNNRVTGLDLTQEYIDVGKALCAWIGLDKQVTLHRGSALKLPFNDASFDGAVMLHVGMNIEDKKELFSEIARVLRPGASFGLYDVMQTSEGELVYPVPWADESLTSKLATPEQYLQALTDRGFNVSVPNHRGSFALEFFKQFRAKIEANGGMPPLGLHTLMQEDTAAKVKNMIDNIAAGLVAPVEIIATKPL